MSQQEFLNWMDTKKQAESVAAIPNKQYGTCPNCWRHGFYKIERTVTVGVITQKHVRCRGCGETWMLTEASGEIV